MGVWVGPGIFCGRGSGKYWWICMGIIVEEVCARFIW